MRRLLPLVAAALLLAGCGDRANLQPAAGQALPPKPSLSPRQPVAAELLGSQPRYRPGRSDELLVKSQVRPDDPFDQPPE